MIQRLLGYSYFVILLVGFAFFISKPAKSQIPHPILSYFTAVVSTNQIQLNWAIAGGNTCEGTIVQHSADGVFFETIGEIGGVCGSPEFEIPYFFIDQNPLANQTNYYRLELGSQGFSSAIDINFVPLNEQGYSLRYDAVNQIAVINFENPVRESVRYVLFSISGHKILEGHHNDDKIELSMHEFSSQIMILHLWFSNRHLNIKILKY